MPATIAFETTIAGFRIVLIKDRQKLYRVVYGQQTKPFLDYTEAAHELGECIMHALQCEGRLHGD